MVVAHNHFERNAAKGIGSRRRTRWLVYAVPAVLLIAALGGFLIGIIETMVVGYWSSDYRDAIAFAVLIVILLVKPTGLLGTSEREKA